MQPDTSEIVKTLLAPGPIGTFTLLIIGIVALHKGYIRLGREVVKLEAELQMERARTDTERTRGDKWQEMLLAQLQQTDRAIAVAKSATSIATGGPTP